MKRLSVGRILLAAALCLVTAAAVLYAGDYAWLRYRMARHQAAMGTVTVYSYYTVEEKNHKTEYLFDRSEAQTCVHSLFPHLGYTPCWYLSRHTEQRTNL